jgi:hypothetical protein
MKMVKEKQKLTLSVDKEVVEKAKKLGINISEMTENVLTGYTSAAEKSDGSLHEAYKKLFDAILPLLKEFECNVQIASTWDYFDGVGQIMIGATYLTPDGSFLVEDFPSSQDHYIYDVKKIDTNEFLSPKEILSKLVNELARSQEIRKEKMNEIMMAKRIVEAMSKTLLRKQPANEK